MIKPSDNRPLAEINVTPLVDVMLVLLIVFMICTPLMHQGLEVTLPKVKGSALDKKTEAIIITLTINQKIILNDKKYTKDTLLEALKKLNPERQIIIQADRRVNYGFVAKIMSQIKTAGFTQVGLATEPS